MNIRHLAESPIVVVTITGLRLATEATELVRRQPALLVPSQTVLAVVLKVLLPGFQGFLAEYFAAFVLLRLLCSLLKQPPRPFDNR